MLSRLYIRCVFGCLYITMSLYGIGCLFVREDDFAPSVALSPKTELELSDIVVTSVDGDFLALLPKNWTFIEKTSLQLSDIFAIAINPEYNASLVFTKIPFAEKKESLPFDNKELIRIGIAKHIAKSSGKVRQLGKGYELILGPKKFGYFEFIGSQQTHKTRSVVCLSSLGNIYEISLVPVPVTGKTAPSEEVSDKLFRSFITAIQY